MSEHIFTLPDLGEGTVEAEVSEWHVNVGDTVQEDASRRSICVGAHVVEESRNNQWQCRRACFQRIPKNRSMSIPWI